MAYPKSAVDLVIDFTAMLYALKYNVIQSNIELYLLENAFEPKRI